MLVLPNKIVSNTLNSCVRMIGEAVSFGSQPLTRRPAHTGGIETNGFFVVSRLSHDRLAKSGPDDKKPDALYWNRGAVALCKRLQKTGKWLRLACGSRDERLIDKLHHYVDSRLSAGYGVGQLLVVPCTLKKGKS